MHRRTLLRGLLGGVSVGLTAPALEVIESVRRSMDTALTDAIGLELLEEWERRADDYTRAHLVTPPLNLLKDALLDFTDIRSALKQGTYVRQRARLWRLAAHLAGMIGVWLTVLGQHRDARAWYHTARRVADACDDEGLQAWAYTRAAAVSLHYGTPASALKLTDKAAALHHRPSATAVRTQTFRARALARMGDQVSARAALAQAERTFDALGVHETADKMFGYTERQFLAHASSAMTNLRDAKAAERLREQAFSSFAAQGSVEHLDQVMAKIEQGMSLLWDSDPTTACHHVMDTISALPSGHRTGLVRVYALAFVAALNADQQRLRAAVELKEFLQSAFPSAPSP